MPWLSSSILITLVLFSMLFLFLFLFRSKNVVDECTVLRKIEQGDTVIEIVDSGCKEGLPHTTGPHTVRMTEEAWTSSRRSTTMNHEHVHLAQKQAEGDWAEWYRRYWEYELLATPPPDLPPKYVHALRPNPDTAVAPWALWRRRYLFFPNYADEQRSLRGAQVLVWDIDKHTLVDPPAAWRTIFCGEGQCPHQYEHPHEIAAEYTAEGSNTPAALKLFAWRKQ